MGLLEALSRSFGARRHLQVGIRVINGTVTGAVFQVFHKWLIGGLRPHFLGETDALFRRQITGTDLGRCVPTECIEYFPLRQRLPADHV